MKPNGGRSWRRKTEWRLGLELLENRLPLASLPAGFALDTIVSGLNQGVAFDFAPDGRIFIAEKAGVIRVADDGALTEFVDIRPQVNSALDRGMLGIAVHPQFPQVPFIYVSYTYDPPGVPGDTDHSRVSRISRFTADATTNHSTAEPGSEIILVGTNSTLANIPEPFVRNPENPACGALGEFVQDCIPSDEFSHTIGALRFGLDGSLFVASGDGANVTTVQDYSVRTLSPDSLSGKILRIDPMTGEGYSDNPFYDGDHHSNRSKVYSLGLRNPFRFTIDPVSGEPLIGDVGWNGWEEVNFGSANFGWPCYEGGNGVLVQQPSYASLAECQAFYATGVAEPAIYAYSHLAGGSSVQVGDLYTGIAYPVEYQGAVFISDFNQQQMSAITLDAQRQVVSVDVFGTGIGGIVQTSAGLDTNLYLLDIFTGELKRLRYVSGGNTPPTAVATATQVTAKAFDFSSAGSFDPDAEPLEYLWDFGDGATSTEANPSHVFSGSGLTTVTLTVTDPQGEFGSDTVDVIVNHLLPVAQIVSPVDGSIYRVGDTVLISGTGVDGEDGILDGTNLQWDVNVHHNEHVHVNFHTSSGQTGTFVAGDHEDNSHFEICLTATDTAGGQDTHCIEIFLEEVNYRFDSFPTGLKLSYFGVEFVTPLTVTAPVNSQRTISAAGSQAGMLFEGWSDSGPATHDITIGPANAALLATYQSTIIVQARGQTGEELIDLQIDEVTVATFAVSDTMMDYPYAINAAVTADQVRVVFTNDLYIPPDYDRGVFVDRIVVNGVEIETEHPSVLSTGTWDGTCDPGFKLSQQLACNGYFQYTDIAAAGTQLVVRARGETGTEFINLRIDNSVVATYALTTALQDYSYTYPGVVTPSQVRVEFINDIFDPLFDRNVVVDHIRIEGVVYESEDPTVLSTGTYDGTSCEPGFKLSEQLSCNGYFQYAEVVSNGSAITIRALGETSEEIIALQINGLTFAAFALTDVLTDYDYVHNTTVTADQVRVVFVNDLYEPPIDRNVIVDHIVIDAITYQTEDPAVLSTGTWDGVSCDPGFKQSEMLSCGGYFQYGQVAAPLEAFAATQAWDGSQSLAEVGFHAGQVGADQDFSRWQNPVMSADVNADGRVTAHDALLIINRLYKNDRASRDSIGQANLSPYFYDVDGNGSITAADALRVINSLRADPESEAVPHPFVATTPAVHRKVNQAASVDPPLALDLRSPTKVVRALASQQVLSDTFNTIASDGRVVDRDDSIEWAVDAVMAALR